MSSNLAVLKQLIELEEKRAGLQAELAALDEKLSTLTHSLVGGSKPAGVAAVAPKAPAVKAAPARAAKAPKAPKAPKAAPAPAAKKGGKRAQRGGLAERILGVLKGAGAKGIHVTDLANELGVSRGNVAVWFATTGKKNKSIKKVAPATYRLA